MKMDIMFKLCTALNAYPYTKSQRFSSRATKWCYRGWFLSSIGTAPHLILPLNFEAMGEQWIKNMFRPSKYCKSQSNWSLNHQYFRLQNQLRCWQMLEISKDPLDSSHQSQSSERPGRRLRVSPGSRTPKHGSSKWSIDDVSLWYIIIQYIDI